MALAVQTVDVPLTGGLSELTDKRLVQPGSWLTLTNRRRKRPGGGFTKRYGTTNITQTTFTYGSGGAATGTLSALVALGALGKTLLACDGTKIYSYSSEITSWIDRTARADTNALAYTFPATLNHRPLYGIANRVVTFDWCRYTDGTIHIAMEVLDTAGASQIYDLVIGETTGAVIEGPTKVDAGYAPRIFVCGSNIVLVYSDGASPQTIKARKKTSAIVAWGAATNLVTNSYTIVSRRAWDAQAFTAGAQGSSFVLVYEDSVNANPVNVNIYASATFALTVGVRLTTVATNYQTVAVAPISGEFIWVATARAAGGLWLVQATACSTTTAVEAFAPATVIGTVPATASSGVPARLSIGRISATNAAVVCSVAESLPTLVFTAQNTITSGAGVGTQVNILGYQIASRIFGASDGRVYAFMRDITYLDAVPNALAASLYMVDLQVMSGDNTGPAAAPNGRIVTRGPMRQLECTTLDFIGGSRVVSSAIVSTNDVHAPAPMLRQLNTTQHPIEWVTATFKDPKRYRFVQAGRSSYLSPGQVYDQNRLAELGFHRIPDIAIATNAAAGVLSAGTYGYCVVLRHINSAGEVTRSCPSVAGTITLAVNRQTTVTSVIGSYTDRQSPDAVAGTSQPEYVVAELYRTVHDGATFYLAQELPIPTKGTTTVTFTDNMTDAVLAAKPVLYTGSLAANLSPPNLKSMVVWQNRVVGIGPDRKTIWISAELLPGEQASFNELFNTYVADVDLTAIGVIDDKLIALGDSTVVAIDGSPADNLGNGNTLTARQISADIGCTDERGIVSTSAGLIFRTRRSFGLLDRSLVLSEIGLAVQDRVNTYPICSSSTYVDRDREARFTMRGSESSTSGICLVFDITTSQWSTYEYSVASQGGAPHCASTLVDGTWYAGSSDGTSVKEDTSLYTDAGAYVASTLESPDIRLGSVAGFQRCRRVMAQGERFTAHDLTVAFAVNDSDSFFQTTTWTDTQIAAFADLPLERVMTHVSQQKGSSIRVKLTDKTPTGGGAIGTGAGVDWFGLSLELGVKKGIGKQLPAAQKQ